MKILLITTLYPGYKEQPKNEVSYAIHYFAKEWVKQGYEVLVLRLWPYYPKLFNFSRKGKRSNKYSFEDEFIMDNVNIIRYPVLKIPKIRYRNKDIKFASSKIIERLEKNFVPDVIVCPMLNPSVYVASNISQYFKKPLIVELHNSDIFYLRKRANYARYMNIEKNINRIGFRSERIKNEYLSIYNGSKTNEDYFQILFGINNENIISSEKLIKKINNPTKTIIVVSTLIPLKNVDTLIKAFAKFNKKYNDYTLKVVGDGPERDKLEKLVKHLNITENVYFTGQLDRSIVLELMEESDIFAMVSSPETFGLVYIEAMAKGCITIGSKGEGIDGVIKDGENGFLCMPKSVDELALTFEKIVNISYDDKMKIAQNAVNTAKSLSQESLSKKYIREITKSLIN